MTPLVPRGPRGAFTIVLKNGWTQQADEVIEGEEHYFIEIGNKTTQIRKSQVKTIRRS